MTLVRAVSRLSLFKDSSHTCPLRMAVRVRPLACLKYSESCRVVGASELKVVFRLQWRAMGQPWGVGSKQETPTSVPSGSLLSSPRMPLENLLWEAEAAVCL